MAGKMIKCAQCGEEVSKRQTLMVPGVGRICRTHEKVEEFKKKQEEDKEANRQAQKMKKADEMLQIMSIVAMIRTQALNLGFKNRQVYNALCHNIPRNIRERVLIDLEERGEMDLEEFGDSFMTFLHMKMRTSERARGTDGTNTKDG